MLLVVEGVAETEADVASSFEANTLIITIIRMIVSIINMAV